MRNTLKSWCCIVPLLLLAGCGGQAGPTHEMAKVSGTVTFGGKPVPAGRVLFLNTKGPSEDADIGPDGKYTVEIAVGETQAAIDYREAPTATNPNRPEMMTPGKSLVPDKYADFKTSGLTTTVKSGENTYDISLE